MKDIIIRNFLPVLILLIYMSCVNTQLAMSGYQISYNELRTNLPGGRQANTSTMRAAIIGINGKGRRLIKEELANEPNSCTQFAGWSPDGKWLLYGSKRKGVRQLFVMDLKNNVEYQITNMKHGHAAMWAYWRPQKK